jgi:GNAT superfamily N-acetyltransferase
MPAVRRATPDDVEALVQLRLALCKELEGIDEGPALRALEEATRRYLEIKLASGEFMAWLAIEEEVIVSMSGLLFFERPPTAGNLAGLDAYIMNMYTVHAWRRQGLATVLLREMIVFVKGSGARRIWLHASEVGRPVYVAVGFVPKTSMMDLIW